MGFRKNLLTGRVTDLSDSSPARYKAEGVEIAKGMKDLEANLKETETYTGKLVEAINKHVQPTRRYADTIGDLENKEIETVVEDNENLSEYPEAAQAFIKNYAEKAIEFNELTKQAVKLNLFSN